MRFLYVLRYPPFSILIALLVFSVGPSAWAQAPPEIASLTVEPRTVDVSDADRTVTVRFGVRHPSGVESVLIGVYRDGRANFVPGATLVAGTAADGTWEGTVTIPRYSRAGTYEVGAHVRVLTDPPSFRTFDPAALRGAGFDPAFAVTADRSDTTPPRVVAFSIDPAAVDVTGGPATVAFSARVTDDLSGLDRDSVTVSISRPGFPRAFGVLQRTSGDALDGTYTGSVTIPTGAAPGTWSVDLGPGFPPVADRISNVASYSAAGLSQAGFPSTVEVTMEARGPAPTTFATRDALETAVPGLPTETFEAGRTDGTFGNTFSRCGAVIDGGTASPCFEPGEVLPGLRLSDGDGALSISLAPPAERYPWSSKAVFVNNIFGVATLDFPGGGVTAIGVDAYNFVGRAGTARATVYAVDGRLLGEFDIAVETGAAGFFGFTSEVAIGRVYLDGVPSLSFFEAVDDVAFGRPLAAVVTAGPTDGADGVPLTPTFDWADFAGAAAYRIQVIESGPDPAPAARRAASDVVVLDVTVSDSRYTVPEGALRPGTAYAWRLAPVDAGGAVGAFTSSARFTTAGAVSAEGAPEGGLALRVWPNPAHSRVAVAYDLTEAADVRVAVYDALGREAAVLADGLRQPGRHEVALESTTLAPGVYVVRVVTEGGAQTARLVIAR